MPERATSTNELPKAKLAYNWEFDQSAYRSLQEARPQLNPQEYQRRRDQLDGRTAENLKSEIRERFCTLEYETSYILKEGKLIHIHHDEPFEEIIKRGIEYRRTHGSTDIVREEAELIGFRKVEAILREVGSKTIVAISPRGNAQSVYKMNFIDVFQKEDEGLVKMTRFTSTASLEKFRQAVQELDVQIPSPIRLTDDYFLSHPIATTASVEEILETIELDATALKKEYVETIVKKCLPLILAYLQNPGERTYRAAVNFADAIAGKSAVGNQQFNNLAVNQLTAGNFIAGVRYQALDAIIDFFGSQAVRPVQTGCGLSGSSRLETPQTFSVLNVWSVVDFGYGEDEYGTRKIHCEECGTTYERESGKLEASCRKCGGTKGITCEE